MNVQVGSLSPPLTLKTKKKIHTVDENLKQIKLPSKNVLRSKAYKKGYTPNCWNQCDHLKRFSAPQVINAYGSDVPFKLAAIKFFAANSSS